MAKRSEIPIAEQLVDVIGYEAAAALIRGRGGKQIVIPDGTGRAGAFTAWLEETIGAEALDKLIRRFGGERLTVPKCYAQALAARNRRIVADFDGGMGILGLIDKYDLTERQLRTVLNRPIVDLAPTRRPVDDNQMALF